MNLNKAINDLLLKIVGNDYNNDSIYFNNENNITLPNSKDNKFIIINELYSIPKTALVYNNNKVDEEQQEVDVTSKQIIEIFIQVDFYSNTSDYIAINNSSKFAVALQSYIATSILKEQGFSIGKAESPKNTTLVMDTDNYICRYSVKFSVFSLSELAISIEGFNTIDAHFFMEK